MGQNHLWVRHRKVSYVSRLAKPRIIHDRSYNRETVNIKAGTLDDTSWLHPVGNLWTRSAQPWMPISDQMLNYEGQPEDILPLWERWSQQD